jgi:SRSO17 transposase
LYGAEIFKVEWKCLESFEMRCWRRMEKIGWTNSEKLRRTTKDQGGKEYPTYCTIKWRKANWIGHIMHRKKM